MHNETHQLHATENPLAFLQVRIDEAGWKFSVDVIISDRKHKPRALIYQHQRKVILLDQSALQGIDISNVFFVRFASNVQKGIPIGLGKISHVLRVYIILTLTAYTRALTAPIPPCNKMR